MIKRGIYLLFAAILVSAYLAVALEQVAESRGSFDVDVGEGVVLIDSGISQQEFCGNDIKEGSEQCDGTDLGGATCSSLISGTSGSLSCKSDCIYDTSNCTAPPSVGPSGGGPSGGGDGSADLAGRTRRETSCIESWQCSDWNECTNGKQARTCTDSAKCGTQSLKPVIERSCSEEPLKVNGETSALNRITGAVVGALRNLRDYEVVGIILFILAIIGSALIINSIRSPAEEVAVPEEKKTGDLKEKKAEVREKPKNLKKAEKIEKVEK